MDIGRGPGSESRRRRYKVLSGSEAPGTESVNDFYILEGKKAVKVASLDEWARRTDLENRHVGLTEIKPGLTVSTVFLGLDHRHTIFGEGPPLLFETMVFENGEGGHQERYSTWEEAEAGHNRIVVELRQRTSA
jgi:hypothetical protein